MNRIAQIRCVVEVDVIHDRIPNWKRNVFTTIWLHTIMLLDEVRFDTPFSDLRMKSDSRGPTFVEDGVGE